MDRVKLVHHSGIPSPPAPPLASPTARSEPTGTWWWQDDATNGLLYCVFLLVGPVRASSRHYPHRTGIPTGIPNGKRANRDMMMTRRCNEWFTLLCVFTSWTSRSIVSSLIPVFGERAAPFWYLASVLRQRCCALGIPTGIPNEDMMTRRCNEWFTLLRAFTSWTSQSIVLSLWPGDSIELKF
jgi:hypothetical protein